MYKYILCALILSVMFSSGQALNPQIHEYDLEWEDRVTVNYRFCFNYSIFENTLEITGLLTTDYPTFDGLNGNPLPPGIEVDLSFPLNSDVEFTIEQDISGPSVFLSSNVTTIVYTIVYYIYYDGQGKSQHYFGETTEIREVVTLDWDCNLDKIDNKQDVFQVPLSMAWLIALPVSVFIRRQYHK